MGIVYKAMDERDGRIVALKVIRETEAKGDESATHVAEAHQRFQREADILRGLLHVNIVDFYEIGEEDGTPYLAMEFLEGQPLGAFEGRPWPETLPLLIQAANGMEYLSSRGIVHRDLSPDNVYVVEKGGERIVKLLDFGVAKLFEKASGSLTATGFFLGKVAYGSPEQLGSLGQEAVLDWRSDAYSLGVIFYQVLAGRRPFEGRVPVELIAAHLGATAPPVAAPVGSPPLPIELVRLVGGMLEKRREDRPRSYREIIDRLVTVLRDKGAAAVDVSASGANRTLRAPDDGGLTSPTSLIGSSGSQLTTLPGKTPPSRKSVARAVLGSALALAIFVGLLVFGPRGREPEKTPPSRPVKALPKAAAGALRVYAAPFANIVSLSRMPANEAVPLEAGATTPQVLGPLAPGVYRIVLSCPALEGREVTREVSVTSGAPTLLVQSFLPPESLAETLR